MPPIEEARAIHRQRIAALQETFSTLPLDHTPLTLEIGSGHGHYLAAYAAAHPDEHCLGIDIIKDRLDKAQRKTDRAGLTNVHWIRADAHDFFAALPPETRFTGRILVLFPDPWPKRKHWKNRLIQPAFLTLLAQFTAPGTPLCFRTDHTDYFAAACDTITHHPDWQWVPDARWPFEQQTVFEAKATAHQSLICEREGEGTRHPSGVGLPPR